MSEPRRVVGYCRVSSELQARGTSLADQQAAIRAYAKTRGLTVGHVFVESESAIQEKYERREQMQTLMNTVRAGDLVVCDKIDRWSRDPEFTYRSIRQILEKGARFYAVGDSCDPSTPEGDTMLNFRVLFAREEYKRIRQRLIGTRQLLRNAGFWVEGVVPRGYKRPLPKGTKGPEKNVLVLVDKEAARVRKIFAMAAARSSLVEISEHVNLAKDQVHKIVRNRFYTGVIENTSREWIPGKHPAIVDHDLWAKARQMQTERKNSPRRVNLVMRTKDWILRDVAKCGLCGGKMTSAYGGTTKNLEYYRCFKRCTSSVHVPVRSTEAAFDDAVLARLTDLRSELSRGEKPGAVEMVDSPDFAAQRLKIDRKRARYVETYSDELISREELKAALAKLDADVVRIDAAERANSRQSRLAKPAVRREVLREVQTLRKAWKPADGVTKRRIVTLLAHSVSLVRGDEPIAVWRSAEELIT